MTSPENFSNKNHLSEEVKTSLHSLSKVELVELSKKLGHKGISNLKKAAIVQKIIAGSSDKSILHIIHPPFWRKHRVSIFGWSSLAGLIVTVVGLLLPHEEIKPTPLSTTNKNLVLRLDSLEFSNLVFSSAQELRHNADFMVELNWHFKNSKYYYRPVGRPSFDQTKELFNSHYMKMMKYTYGEEKYLLKEILQLEHAISELVNIKTENLLKDWNDRYNMTLDDATFLCGFYYWYISTMARDILPRNLYYSLGYNKAKDNFEQRIDTSNLYMKFLHREDHGYIRTYTEYLGFID